MEEYRTKMEGALDAWEEVPLDVRSEVERHFKQARDRGYAMDEDEYEWRRVGVARSLIEAREDDGELSDLSKAGIRGFPKFADGSDWELYLRDFDELIEPTRSIQLRIRMLRQVMGSEAKKRNDP